MTDHSPAIINQSRDLFSDHSMSEGVLSDDEIIPETFLSTQQSTIPNSNAENNQTETSTTNTEARTVTPSPKAQVNLYDDEFLAQLPEELKTLHMISQTHNLSRINPMKLYTCLNNLCGEIENLTHLRNGGLLLECKTCDQAKTLLKTKVLYFSNPNMQVTVKTTISLSKGTSAGKIYAPELQDMELDEILELLKPSGAIEIQKLLSGASKAHIPLYIIKFIGSTCPQQIKIGYSRYNVDKYIPNPLCCSNCWRWGHGAKFCRSKKRCRNCGNENHSHENCISQPHCTNCRGLHSANSSLCPVLQREKNICKIHVEKQITLKEARQQVINSSKRQVQTTHNNYTPLQQQTRATNGNTQISSQTNETIPNSIYLPPLSQPTNSQFVDNNSTYGNNTTYGNNSTYGSDPSQNYPSLPSLVNLQSQEEQCTPDDRITPGQKLTQSQKNQSYSSTLKTNSNRHPQPTIDSSQPQPVSQHENKLPWLQNLIKTMLPIMIRMIFAPNSTARLECLHEMGTILSMEKTITEIISNLGYTSLING